MKSLKKPIFDIKVDLEKAKTIKFLMTNMGNLFFYRKKYFSRKDTLKYISIKKKGVFIG